MTGVIGSNVLANSAILPAEPDLVGLVEAFPTHKNITGDSRPLSVLYASDAWLDLDPSYGKPERSQLREKGMGHARLGNG